MWTDQRKDDGRSFAKALRRYRRARAALDTTRSIKALERVDVAIDGLLAAVSGSPADTGMKLSILRDEYGLELQPRHAAGLYGDIPMLEPRAAEDERSSRR